MNMNNVETAIKMTTMKPGTSYFGVVPACEGPEVKTFYFVGREKAKFSFVEEGSGKVDIYTLCSGSSEALFCQEKKQYIFPTRDAAVLFERQQEALKTLSGKFLSAEQVEVLTRMACGI